MRIVTSCRYCGKEKKDLYPLDILDDGIYDVNCKFGHKEIFVFQELPFELLFDIVLHAILDGYLFIE